MARTMRTVAGIVMVGALGACGFPKTADGPPPALSADQVDRAVTQSPGSSPAALTAGHDLFAARCNGCHGYPDIAAVPAEKWPDVMTRMAKKSKLTDEQAAQVLAFVQASKRP